MFEKNSYHDFGHKTLKRNSSVIRYIGGIIIFIQRENTGNFPEHGNVQSLNERLNKKQRGLAIVNTVLFNILWLILSGPTALLFVGLI